MRSIWSSKRAALAQDHGSNGSRTSIIFHAALALAGAICATACGVEDDAEPNLQRLAGTGQSLVLGAHDAAESSAAEQQPATDYTLFEADPVRPVAVLKKSGLVAVANGFDDSIELHQSEASGVRRCGGVKVGMRPVAVLAVRESRGKALLWVVNHISDSISIVDVDTSTCRGEVVDTLYTGDEPRDIVMATTHSGQRRVFVTAAHRGQHHPIESARLGTDLVTPPSEKAMPGLADVFVFDPDQPRAQPAVVNLFTEVPRALAVGDGVVYAAGFRTGNRTSVVQAERVVQRGLDSLSELLSRDDAGNFVERGGELRLKHSARGRARIEGGMPAVVGYGRCMPDPRPERRQLFAQQVCVATDREHRVERVFLQHEGEAHETCRCTSGQGALQPTTSVIVKFFATRAECGKDYHTFPDGSRGCWLDADPNGIDTPAARAADLERPMAWNDEVKLTLPDTDVFAIDVDDLRVTREFAGVGTVLFGMAVQPTTGRVFVTNTDANNLTRFEGPGESSSSTLIGHLHESRVTVIDPRRNQVRPVHLNDHIDYSRCCERRASENENSFAFPTAGTFSEDGQTFYFSALGSDSVGVVAADAIGPGFQNLAARRSHRLRSIRIGAAADMPAGPVGLALDPARSRLYVKTHFTNELVVIDTQTNRIIDRSSLYNPEPESIQAGREVFYDAHETSSHGDSACASCHAFGDFDGLSWDLGDPDGVTVNNPGPFVVAPELFALRELAADPFAEAPNARPGETDFRSNKGPMNTQTLRGMANHGALHWRGDRTRRFQDEPGRQPNYGSLDENNSFNEFDVAIRGLNGNDRSLEPELFQAFTNFALQLTLPPNPLRKLDNSLTPEQARARASYFGCRSISDAQLEKRQCIALDGARVDIDIETQRCRCASNPLSDLLRGLPQAAGAGNVLKLVFADPATRAAFDALAADTRGLPAAAAAEATLAFEAFRNGRAGLLDADLALDATGLIPLDPALALAGSTGPILKLVALSRSAGTDTGRALLDLLASAVATSSAAGAFDAAGGVEPALTAAFGLANLDIRTAADEAARGTGEFHNLLEGCSLTEPEPVCRLRVTDSFETCNGCHTLDHAGNAEHDVYRPGFFGTSGEYSFENLSQLLKIPHLRNVYQKAGMFGAPLSSIELPESVLGAKRGGFFAPDNAFMGPQVRGFGFLHDGAIDTVDRFHGAAVFATRAPLALGTGDPGNAQGFEPVLPEPARRGACVQSFRQAGPEALDIAEDPELRAALELCLESGPVPASCFLDPDTSDCEAALEAVGEALGQGDFAVTFAASIRPACFQLGSMLEQGSPAGNCAPEGLRDRAEMESFMMVFDTNLAPMVGQQLTLRDGRFDDPLLEPMLRAAERRQCDIGLRQNDRGYLVTRPKASDAASSQVTSASGRRLSLGALRASTHPATLTCYPPQPDRAEARRSAFDGSGH